MFFNKRVIRVNKNKEGFTILELILVLVVMSILLYISVPLYNKTVKDVSKTNVSVQIKSLNDIAASTAKSTLKKVKIRFESNTIQLIQMNEVAGVWQDESIIDIVTVDSKLQISTLEEVIYGIDGLPEEDKTINIISNSFNLKIDIYKDGRIIIQDI